MSADRDELMADLDEFLRHVVGNPEKSFKLTLTARGGRYMGGELCVSKQAGKGLRIIED